MRKGNIPGIHNYCDRWCERCPFTSRCAVAESESKLSAEQLDANNKVFWDTVAKNFEKAIGMLYKEAEKRGIDLDAVVNSDEVKQQQKQRDGIREQLKKHELYTTSMHYATLVREWMKKNELFEQKGQQILDEVEMGIKDAGDAKAEALSIKDCAEVIQWYAHFIAVKFMRALSGKADDDGWEEENGFPKDSDGSAKIALIGVERSLAAWSTLYEQFNTAEDEILQILATLQKIKRIGLSEFPNAMAFIRPGFDDNLPA